MQNPRFLGVELKPSRTCGGMFEARVRGAWVQAWRFDGEWFAEAELPYVTLRIDGSRGSPAAALASLRTMLTKLQRASARVLAVPKAKRKVKK